ncbi:MAG: hypothetical protein AAF481_12245 [Acidobacteriota bacterium]
MTAIPQHFVAVDWSGAKNGSRKKIWLAEADAAGEMQALENGRSREQARDRLIEIGREESDLVVGLDFAFSCPKWFVRECGCSSATEFWKQAERHADQWLAEQPCKPFYRKGPQPSNAFRATDIELREQGLSPETVFKLVGATQVGPGSIRGMPILADLQEAGFSIWPFDPPKLPLVVEIYPRLFYGTALNKSSLEARVQFLDDHPEFTMDRMQRIQAQCSDDAFDAAVSAFAMCERRAEFSALPTPTDTERLEGKIWG